MRFFTPAKLQEFTVNMVKRKNKRGLIWVF